jgi:hypothetical protein
LSAVDGEVVQVALEVRKPQFAVLEPLNAETDRKPTRGEVHSEVQIPAALDEAAVKGIGDSARHGRALQAPRRPPSRASLRAS